MVVEGYSRLENKNTNSFEWRANSFASNFLLPKELIKSEYNPVREYEIWIDIIRQIAKRFKVSSQVVIISLVEMNWVDEDLKQRFFNERQIVIKSQDKIDPEIPHDLSIGQKERLTQVIRHGLSWYFIELCTEAYRRGGITYHKLLEMLSLPLEQGYELLHHFRTFIEVVTQ